ncbi:MAG: hypothetical protein ACQCN3_10660 [Candidatus Bathyarchaeia archaeon]|jgi:hypothetical protein
MKLSSKGCPVALIICGLLLASSSLAETVNGSPYAKEGSPAPNDVFTILGTNSTISEPIFDSTSSKITFNVTGPSDTSGYVWCKVAESLVPGCKSLSGNVNVSLDGNTISYMYTHRDDSWELYFNYTHSNHEVAISLPMEKWTILGVDPLICAGLLIVCIPLVAVIVSYHRKQRHLQETEVTFKLNAT